MSRIFPDPLVGHFPAGIIEVYRVLRAVPGDDLAVWVRLPLPGAGERPDFLVVSKNRHAFLLAVADYGQADFEEAAGLSLFRADGRHTMPGQKEARRLPEFFHAALADHGDSGRERAATGLVIFPHVRQHTLELMPPDIRPQDVFLLGREYCQPGELARFFEQETPQELEDGELAALRAAYTPESVVPARFSPFRAPNRNLNAGLTPLLLDYDQEKLAKQRLVLSPEGAALAGEDAPHAGASLVTGVAGSGKSLVLLFRACTQARLAPGSKSLVLTHNRALKAELESRFGELGRPPNVEWHTFYSWIHKLLSQRGKFPAIVQYDERDRLVAECAQSTWGSLSASQVEFLGEEFDWMQDRDLVEEGAYLAADRTGRGVRLGEGARRKVFAAFSNYRARLEVEGREDWSGVALLAWRLARSGEIEVAPHDFVYIDEAQFFAPVWFRLIRRALRPDTGRLFLAADPTQGFLKRRQAWSHCGLDLRGRSARLRKSYRSTRQILAFASDFYRRRLEDDELPVLNLPEDEELASALEGDLPVTIPLSARQDEFTRVGNEIEACLRGGVPPGDILVIVAGENRFAQGLAVLRKHLGEDRVQDARETTALGRVRVCGINAATGLEAPVVFVAGVADLLSGEAGCHLKDEARVELIRDNTRRIYMAFTRAARKLVITWTGSSPPPWTGCGG